MTDIYLKKDWKVKSFSVSSTGTAILDDRSWHSFTIKNTSGETLYLYRNESDVDYFPIYPNEWHSFVTDVYYKDSGDITMFFLKSESSTISIPILIVYRI